MLYASYWEKVPTMRKCIFMSTIPIPARLFMYYAKAFARTLCLLMLIDLMQRYDPSIYIYLYYGSTMCYYVFPVTTKTTCMLLSFFPSIAYPKSTRFAGTTYTLNKLKCQRQHTFRGNYRHWLNSCLVPAVGGLFQPGDPGLRCSNTLILLI